MPSRSIRQLPASNLMTANGGAFDEEFMETLRRLPTLPGRWSARFSILPEQRLQNLGSSSRLVIALRHDLLRPLS